MSEFIPFIPLCRYICYHLEIQDLRHGPCYISFVSRTILSNAISFSAVGGDLLLYISFFKPK